MKKKDEKIQYCPDEKIRYCPIKNINRLACKNKNSRQICRKCYKTFSVNKDMNKHRKICN